MHESGETQAWWVAREGRTGRVVLAADWLTALAQALAADGEIAALDELTCRVTDAGVVVRSNVAAWTVRRHMGDAGRKLALQAIGDAEDLATACERALAAARQVVPTESGAVLLVHGPHLRFASVFGPQSDALRGVRLPKTAGVAGYALQTLRAAVVGDAGHHPRHFRTLDAITGYETRQIVAVPVVGGGVAHGVIELMNPPEKRAFHATVIRRLEDVARVLGDYLARRGA